jgi:hypothetical protein
MVNAFTSCYTDILLRTRINLPNSRLWVVPQFEIVGDKMEKTFTNDEKMKAAEAVSRLIYESPIPTKIELVKSERGFVLTSFALEAEDAITTS